MSFELRQPGPLCHPPDDLVPHLEAERRASIPGDSETNRESRRCVEKPLAIPHISGEQIAGGIAVKHDPTGLVLRRLWPDGDLLMGKIYIRKLQREQFTAVRAPS